MDLSASNVKSIDQELSSVNVWMDIMKIRKRNAQNVHKIALRATLMGVQHVKVIE